MTKSKILFLFRKNIQNLFSRYSICKYIKHHILQCNKSQAYVESKKIDLKEVESRKMVSRDQGEGGMGREMVIQ